MTKASLVSFPKLACTLFVLIACGFSPANGFDEPNPEVQDQPKAVNNPLAVRPVPDPEFDYDGDGLIGVQDRDVFIAELDDLHVKIKSFKLLPQEELDVKMEIKSSDVITTQIASEVGASTSVGASMESNASLLVTPMGTIGGAEARFTGHASVSANAGFQFSDKSRSDYERVVERTTKSHNWYLKVVFDLTNSSKTKLTLKALQMNLNYGRGKADIPLVRLKADNLDVPVDTNGRWDAPHTFELSKDTLAKIMKKGIAISLKINPASIIMDPPNQNNREINKSCCSVVINNGKTGTYKRRVSVLADANTATIAVDELLQRTAGQRKIVWGLFDGRDYLQKFQDLGGTPIPVPYKRKSGFWVVRLFDKTGEVELKGNWRTLEVGTDAKITVTYKLIDSYLDESENYTKYPSAVNAWIETKQLEEQFWKTIASQSDGQETRVEEVDDQYDILKKKYRELKNEFPTFFDHKLFTAPEGRLEKILKERQYTWEPFMVRIRSAKVNWTVKKAMKIPNWNKNPVLKLKFDNYAETKYIPAKGNEPIPVKEDNEFQHWEVALLASHKDGKLGDIKYSWLPYGTVKYRLEETDFVNDIFIETDSSSFYSLALIVENVHFRDFAKHGIVKPSYCKFRLHSVKGPISTLRAIDLNVDDPGDVTNKFIDANMPKVVSQQEYSEFFGKNASIAEQLSSEGTQVGYSRAGYVLDAYSKIPDDKLSSKHLVDSIEKFSRALEFEKVTELGDRLEPLKIGIIQRGEVGITRLDYAAQLVSMAKTCKELKSYDGLYSINYAIQNMFWALDRIQGNPVEKVKGDEKKILQGRLEQITVDLDGLDQNPMERTFLTAELARLSTMVDEL